MILAWRIGNDENLEKISRKKLYLSYSLKEKKKSKFYPGKEEGRAFQKTHILEILLFEMPHVLSGD